METHPSPKTGERVDHRAHANHVFVPAITCAGYAESRGQQGCAGIEQVTSRLEAVKKLILNDSACRVSAVLHAPAL